MAMLFNGVNADTVNVAALPQQALSGMRSVMEDRGIVNRDEAEFLFVLDRSGCMVGADFTRVTARAVARFVVSASGEAGHVGERDADWLLGLAGDQPTAFGRTVLLNVVREAAGTPPRIAEAVMRASVGRSLLV